MFSFKLNFIIFTINLTFGSRIRLNDFEPYARFTTVQCSSSNVTVSDFKCFVKAYSRKNTSLNLLLNISRPIYDIKARYEYRSKSIANAYRSLINVTIDICKVLNGTNSNPVFNWLMGMIPDLKVMLHPCPLEVFYGLN